MNGPPCTQCGSTEKWLPGKDGTQCECGWPGSIKKKSFGESSLGGSLGCAAIILAIGAAFSMIIWAMHN